MRFTLYYRGPLKSNGDRNHKHDLRQYFDPQLRMLWEQQPLKNFRSLLNIPPRSDELSAIYAAGPLNCAALVSDRLHMVAELDLLLLRPAEPGQIVDHGGDIDNRLKTLLDALRVPFAPELPEANPELGTEGLLHCLMSDDSLITKLSVEMDRLLAPTSDPSEVVLLIRVVTLLTQTMVGTIGLG